MVTGYEDAMQKLFDDLLHKLNQLGGEMYTLEDLSDKGFEKIAHDKEFELFKRVVTAMYQTSTDIDQIERKMECASKEALKKARNKKDKQNIEKVMKIIESTGKNYLTIAERLPLSLDKSWKPGCIGPNNTNMLRAIVNIPGFLLLALAPSGKTKVGAYHEKSLYLIREAIRVHEKTKKEKGYPATGETEKDVKKAAKDFKVLMRTNRLVTRKWKRADKDCKKLYPKLISIDYKLCLAA
jgi:hypothetical protein